MRTPLSFHFFYVTLKAEEILSFIVPAASGPEQVVVNGMSPSNRGSRWSNSGMVVEIQPEDFINEELFILLRR